MIFPIKIIGGTGTNGVPIEVPTAAEMESILSNATAQTVGIIYKYTGTTTDKYINSNLYTVKQSGNAYVFVGLSETVTVQYNLTHCSVTPAPQFTAVGQPFGLNITADSGYKIDDDSKLAVVMGGAAVVQEGKDKVYIASVTGDISIVASATPEVQQLPTPQNVAVSGDTLSWNSVANATGYRIKATNYVAGTASIYKDVTATSLDLTTWTELPVGSVTLEVMATSTSSSWSDSNYSEGVLYAKTQKLDTPVLSQSGGVLSWAAIANATKYKVYAAQSGTVKYTSETTELSVTISDFVTAAGTYDFTVQAIGTYPYTDSNESNSISYTIQNKLATPTIALSSDGTTLQIVNVDNATSYDIYVNGEYKTNVVRSGGSINPDFATATPQELKNAVITGQAASLYAVGSTRQITLKNGQVITLRLANNTTDLYERAGESGTTGFVLEFVECFGTKYYMNSTDTNAGGWNACYMRTTVMPLILAQLPDEWQEVVATVKTKAGNGYSTGNVVIKSDDKLFLPAEREIFASRNYSAQAEWDALTRWQWYAQNDTAASRIKKYNDSGAWWWERSPNNSNGNIFCFVNGIYSSGNNANGSGGVAPAFCI